tara:strand:+ start:17181 stop:17378 length:198 start_codon:yes stop_codon:yes gene_type:complete
MNYILDNLCHYADFLAIPYFLLLTIYFLRIKDKSIIEYILLSFSISGLVFDTIFSGMYCYKLINN